MKRTAWIVLTVLVVLLALLWLAGLVSASRSAEPLAPQAGAPTIISYQGQVTVSGAPYSGTAYFKFAIVNQAGDTTYWSNDGSSVGGSQPTTAVILNVTNGLFSTLLGDTSIMLQPLPATVFSSTDRYLRVWFSTAGVPGTFTQLAPDRRIAAVPYALQAEEAKNAAAAGNADLLDGQHGVYYQDAGSLNAGTVATDRYSAYADLGAEGYLGDAAGDLARNNSALQTTLNADLLDGQHGSAFWNLSGNAGTAPETNFLGTTDNISLTLRVNNAGALRLEPNATSPNLIGGYEGNTVTSGVKGAAIGGGGANGLTNRVTDDYGTVAGGTNNQAGDNAGTTSDRTHNTIGGGYLNVVSGWSSTIGGGRYNAASNGSCTIGGGEQNSAIGYYSTIGGGVQNQASGPGSVIGGGGYDGGNWRGNTALGNAATIGGGLGNSIGATSYNATIGGGSGNEASGWSSTIGGGEANKANNTRDTVAGGYDNTASGGLATVGGGARNTASGISATVPGGFDAGATLYGQMAYASGRFASQGDAQASLYVMRNTSTGAGWVDLYLDGSAAYLTIAAGRTMTFDILLVGRENAGGESAGYEISGVVENVGGTTALIGSPTVATLGEDDATWNVQVLASDALDALSVQVKGNGESIRWVATVRTAEVGW